MDQQLDDFDYLYDDLPEMCDTPSICYENTPSSSCKEDNSASLHLENLSCEAPFQNIGNVTAVKCACHESVEWLWDSDNKSQSVEILEDKLDVKFHRAYSNGTAVVRCTEPMVHDQYYWEVKMTGPVYGTDVMVGVGTPDANFSNVEDRFVSLLGMDNRTWGYSYTGLFHHNGQRRCYAQSFSQGSTIGVHLDLWKGTLTFYKDRRNLGIASSGLKGKTLYAMAASTAARSQMRMVYSGSFPSSLQFLCCSKLRELVPDDRNVLDVIDVPPGLKHYLSTKLSWLLDKRQIEKNHNHCCRIIDPQREDRAGSATASIADRIVDPLILPNMSRQFILLGSVLFSNHNRFQRAIRDHISEELEDNLEGSSKRQRCSYDKTMKHGDHDSE